MADSARLTAVRKVFGHTVDNFFYVSLKHRYVYVQTPKVASTTLKARLAELECRGSNVKWDKLPNHPTPEQSVHVRPFQLPDEMLDDALFGHRFYRFAFVRDPFRRVLSGYLDKIKGNPEAGKFVSKMRVPTNGVIGFDDFLEFLYSTRSNSGGWNVHWRPAYLLLRPDLIPYDKIGKLESFDADFNEIGSRIGVKLDATITRTAHKTTPQQGQETYYSDRAIQIVQEVYRQDFEAFNYSDTGVRTVQRDVQLQKPLQSKFV